MRKYLSTGLFGTILGLAVGAPADAALVSRGFLDEALENYATTTALDLKANQSDFTDLSNKIGDTWPYSFDMSFGLNYLSWVLYPPEITLENVSDLVRFLFGGALESGINQGGVLNLLGESVFYTGAYDINTGQIDDGFRSLLQLTDGWTDSQKKTYLGVKGLNDKIGTLPSGNFPDFPESEDLFSWLRQPHTYPTSLAELITALYSNPEASAPGLLAAIIASFPFDTDGDGSPEEHVGLIPNFYLARAANDTAKANATKIGTLPTEYETVGAALTAIKGIAEDAKADALSAIPDPKAEGSTGKFVLTVDIVGDNATYRWEKIDRESETTTTTNE